MACNFHVTRALLQGWCLDKAIGNRPPDGGRMQQRSFILTLSRYISTLRENADGDDTVTQLAFNQKQQQQQ